MPVPMHDVDRQDLEQRVVALERSGLGVLRPVELEGDLRDVAVARPFAGDEFGALRRAAVQQHHFGVLGVDLVQPVPDQAMVVKVEPAGRDRPDLFGAACSWGLEGLVSKPADCLYRAGRSKDWVKVKNRKHPAYRRVQDQF